ncbi:MAG: SBBP repeat-containing protein, partial [Fibrella sp.]|nr:SBBP repeat-containing protein [Armatimonadota bacterium]
TQGGDTTRGMGVDSAGNVYLAGTTGAADFPTLNAHQATYGGNTDGFVSKLAIGTPSVTVTSPNQFPSGPVTISGTGTPGNTVRVELNGVSITVTVDASGDWSVTFPNLPPGNYTVTITVTNPDSGQVGTISYQIVTTPEGTISATEYIVAYATSGTSVRLCWSPVNAATGYEIYTSTVSGVYNFGVPSLIVASNQNFNGRFHVADVSGLSTGVRHYFVIKTLKLAQKSVASEEDSVVTDAGAVPWNRTPGEIIDRVTQIVEESANLEDPHTGELLDYELMIMGPDGTMYDAKTSSVFPVNAVDTDSQTDYIGDISVPSTYWDDDPGDGLASLIRPQLFPSMLMTYTPFYGVGYTLTGLNSVAGLTPMLIGQSTETREFRGALRRLWSVRSEANRSIAGVKSQFIVPGDGQGAQNRMQMNSADGAINCYVGAHDVSTRIPGANRSGFEIDAGMMYLNQETDVPGVADQRWTPMIRISDGNRPRGRDQAKRVLGMTKRVINTLDEMPLGGRFDMSLEIISERRAMLWQSFCYSANQSVPIHTYIGYSAGGFNLRDVQGGIKQGIQMKRQVSIDYKLARRKPNDPPNQPVDADIRLRRNEADYSDPEIIGSQFYYRRNDSIPRVQCNANQLLIGGVWTTWTTNLVPTNPTSLNTRGPSNFWHSQFIGLTPAIAGSPTQETVNIDMNR